jgi:hypothetical protein
MSESSTELTVLDRPMGEIVNVRTASTKRLAEWVDALGELRRQIAEEEDAVQQELVRRMDHEAATTLLEGDFELKVPGANAGTTVYVAETLEEVLQTLIMAGTISETAAAGALGRGLEMEVEVPFSASPESMADALRDAVGIEIAGVAVRVIRCGAVRKPSVPGVNRLAKLPGVAEALERARELSVAPPRRRVKVAYRGRRL